MKLSSPKLLALGFALIILVGALILMLPVSSRDRQTIAFIDALFTSTSATCVTGLIVFDTWTQFSLFGQVVIIALIQIGGLGFMTFAILFSMMLGKRIGLKERSFMMDAISSMQIGGVVRLVRRILIGTLAIEGLGAVLLAIRFCRDFGLWRGVWYGIFHSIAAFCNAGFDLMGHIAPYTSLTTYVSDPLVILTISALIVVGGIGFVVWDDIARHKWRLRRYSLHAKVVLSATAGLLLLSTGLFLLLEWNNTFADLPLGGKLLAAIFQAVTPRTAGFNTVDIAALTDGSSLLTIILMFIGAAPGSTGGGIKITTFVVMMLAVSAHIRRREDANIFRRRIEPGVIRRAFCSVTFYLFLVLTGCFIIMGTQQLPMRDVFLEGFSAIGTVGLSTGISRSLSVLSKTIIVLLMYSGRVGSLTVFMAATEDRAVAPVKKPIEKIIIG